MSRLGKTPIPIPKGVEINLVQGIIHVKGPKGALHLDLPKGFALKVEVQEVVLEQIDEVNVTSALHGLYRSLLQNHIKGVAEGYEVKLAMIGVGYRASVQGRKLDLQIGCSHPVVLDIPNGIEVLIEKGTEISIKGVDKREVGQFAAIVRSKKPPEPYKGKGIRYKEEYVRKKEGKAAKGKA